MNKMVNLYGVQNSNRRQKDHWGKNQFNSSFPVALACYMKEHSIKPIHLSLASDLSIVRSEIDFSDVFGSGQPWGQLYFAFESKYLPYQYLSYDDIGGIDLVVKDIRGVYLCALEVKLTVLPDGVSSKSNHTRWGSEIVFRPATTKYCALQIAHSCCEHRDDIRQRFEPEGSRIQDWSNQSEVLSKLPSLVNTVDDFQREYYKHQRPILMQPIWKTKGQSPILDDNAFDIFVWSDFALTRLFLDRSANAASKSITRQMRSAARFYRFMFSFATAGRVPLNSIYTEMAFSHQTDKEFAVNGLGTNRYMFCDRLLQPILRKDVLEVIVGDGMKYLRPERRFDQTLYFTMATEEQRSEL